MKRDGVASLRYAPFVAQEAHRVCLKAAVVITTQVHVPGCVAGGAE